MFSLSSSSSSYLRLHLSQRKAAGVTSCDGRPRMVENGRQGTHSYIYFKCLECGSLIMYYTLLCYSNKSLPQQLIMILRRTGHLINAWGQVHGTIVLQRSPSAETCVTSKRQPNEELKEKSTMRQAPLMHCFG